MGKSHSARREKAIVLIPFTCAWMPHAVGVTLMTVRSDLGKARPHSHQTFTRHLPRATRPRPPQSRCNIQPASFPREQAEETGDVQQAYDERAPRNPNVVVPTHRTPFASNCFFLLEVRIPVATFIRVWLSGLVRHDGLSAPLGRLATMQS
jgi:hypothetical protein